MVANRGSDEENGRQEVTAILAIVYCPEAQPSQA